LSELEPEIHGAELSDDVRAARALAESSFGESEAYWRPSIEAHLAAYADSIDVLVGHHRDIADRTDIEIGADTRWSAIWELGGRCLAIARVVLHDMRGGFASEADGNIRSLHEAVQLLAAVAYFREDDALRRWLAGKWIRPAEVREIHERQQEYADDVMRQQGLEPEGGNLRELGAQIYSVLSTSAHHERGGFPESLSPKLRQFAYGPHPEAERQAAHLNYVGELLEEVVLVVGAAFRDIIRGDFYAEVVQPLQARLHEVRAAYPLPE